MLDFEHERLDVYRAAIAWLIIADEIATQRPRGRAYLVDQLTAMVLRLNSGPEPGSGSGSGSGSDTGDARAAFALPGGQSADFSR